MRSLELRRLDHTLSEDHTDPQAAFRQFGKTHCSVDTVWAAVNVHSTNGACRRRPPCFHGWRGAAGGNDGGPYPGWSRGSAEAASAPHLVRARGWALPGGDPGDSAKQIAQIVATRESRGTARQFAKT